MRSRRTGTVNARGPGRASTRPRPLLLADGLACLGDERVGLVPEDVGAGRVGPGMGCGRVRPRDRHHPSQPARSTLSVGVHKSYNTARFLGRLPGQRGARGPTQLHPGDHPRLRLKEFPWPVPSAPAWHRRAHGGLPARPRQ